jgi:HEAT repeat protein
MPLVRKPATPANPAPLSPAADAARILTALKSPNPDERWAAARDAVGLDGGAAAMAAALRVEAQPHVREALFTGLARIGTPESAEQLVAFLRSDESQLRTGALDVLHTMPECVRVLLPRLLADPDSDVRILCCELARALPGAEAAAVLSALLEREPHANVCAAAVDVLAEVGTPEACPVLARCAARFPNHAFLAFAIKVATDRITSQSARARD